MRKRVIVKLLVATVVAGATFAMAATLNLTGDGLGAGSTTVASCDADGVQTSFTTAWDATDERYEVTDVVVAGIADTCDGKAAKVTLTDGTGASLGEKTGTIAVGVATTETFTLNTALDAAAVSGTHVTIAG